MMMTFASGATGNSHRLTLLDKPELLSNYVSDLSTKDFVPLKNHYEKDSDNGDYQSFNLDSTNREHAQEIMFRLNKKNRNRDNGRSRRNLFTTGHLADIVNQDCSAQNVYKDTDYDNGYQPICDCVFDQNIGEVLMECYLGDEECTTPPAGGSVENTTCLGTHELFFFSDTDGDLSNKLTCNVCRSDNCNGIKETCTEVAFNDEYEPAVCQVILFPSDDAEAGSPNSQIQVCADCTICGNKDTGYGLEHTCFDAPTTGCDVDSYAHLHNFASAVDGTKQAVGGLFGVVCAADSPDRVLYNDVTYDSGYSAICDCDDPSEPAVECDLYHDECHANLCTDISERFFFSADTGEYEAKWTVNWETSLWTQTIFDSASGRATSCSVLGNDPQSGDLVQCTNCQICDSAQGGAGIKYDCFGQTPETSCDPAEGRAKFNFPIPGGVTDGVGQLNPPVSTTPNSGQQGFNPTNEEDSNNTLAIVLGALFGGMAVAFIFVLIVRQRNSAPLPSPADDMTLDESVVPHSVVGGGGVGDQDFSIDDLDETIEAPPSIMTPDGSMADEELQPTEEGIMT